MKKPLIIIAIIAVGTVAVIDTKARIKELDEISANTPSQVEMKKNAPKSSGSGIQEKFDNVHSQKSLDNQKFNNMVNTPKKFTQEMPKQKENQTQIP